MILTTDLLWSMLTNLIRISETCSNFSLASLKTSDGGQRNIHFKVLDDRGTAGFHQGLGSVGRLEVSPRRKWIPNEETQSYGTHVSCFIACFPGLHRSCSDLSWRIHTAQTSLILVFTPDHETAYNGYRNSRVIKYWGPIKTSNLRWYSQIFNVI